ncbi:MAG: hypothetical protein KatS3mg111_2343 [Pirellulaceae bacterium]|nr:MAG: hypothetical protein KatS3mg111_2343 [Pirellulaceae bacterium]
MNVLVIAGIGVALVLVLILWLRLHPMISLLLASLFLLAATPEALFIADQVADQRYEIVALSGTWIGLRRAPPEGAMVLIPAGQSVEQAVRVELRRLLPSELVRAAAAGQTVTAAWHWYEPRLPPGATLQRGDVLVPAHVLQEARRSRWSSLGERLTQGFARTVRKLGIPVAMAAVVGACLLESGAAERLVAFIMAVFGRRGTAPALATSGFFLGIPVFFDNVFYLLLPLAKAAGRFRPAHYVTSVMAILVGATMAHSLVPPTPGPLLVATTLDIDLGLMMLGGIVVGGAAACCGLLYGRWCSRWLKLPVVDAADDHSSPPSPARSVPLSVAPLPILVPILLLSGSAVLAFAMSRHAGLANRLASYQWLIDAASDSTLVFLVAGLLAIIMVHWFPPRAGTPTSVVAKGLSDAGMIVLLTSAGGGVRLFATTTPFGRSHCWPVR